MRSVLSACAVGAWLVTGCSAPATEVAVEDIPSAFIASSQAAQRTMHMNWVSTYDFGGLEGRAVELEGSLDFAGDDYAGSVSFAAGDVPDGIPQDRQTEIALVAGQAYQRSPGSAQWERTAAPARSLDPLRGLTADQLTYVGRASLDARDLHHLRVEDEATIVAIVTGSLSSGLPVSLPSFNPSSATFGIFVDDLGRPVGVAISMATDGPADEFGVMQLQSNYRYSNWGAEIYIVPPPG